MKKIRSMVLVSGGPFSLQHGAQQIFDELKAEISALGLDEEVHTSLIGDVGRHEALPLMILYPEALVFGPLTPQAVHLFVDEYLQKGQIPPDLGAVNRELTGKLAWLNARKGTLPIENRIVWRLAGVIDPISIEEYILHDGYQALGKSLSQLTTPQVI